MSQVEAIKARLDEYTALVDVLETKPSQVAPGGTVMVYLGDGYFTEMDLDEAKEFVGVRLKTLKTQHEGILYSQGITEEGLPIMDIYEELDEDGNVINSSVERTGGSMDKIKQALNGIYKEHEARLNSGTGAPDKEPRIREIAEPAEPQVVKPSQNSGPGQGQKVEKSVAPGPKPGNKAVKNLDSPAEPPAEPKEDPKEEPKEDPELEHTPADTFHGISRDDMIELELLSEDIGNMQVKMDEDEQIDEFDDEFEFEYDEDASEESDEDEFGRTKGSLFPTDPRTAMLLEQHLTKKRTGSKKSVSFSPSLEIKEFETTSAERKGQIHDPEVPSRAPPTVQLEQDVTQEEDQEPQPKMSLFKQRMGPARSVPKQANTIEKPAVSDIIEKPAVTDIVEKPAVTDIVEKPAVADIVEKPSQSVSSSIKEKPTAPTKPVAKSSFYSRKYAPANRSVVPKPLNVPETDDSTVPPEFVQHTNDPRELDLQQLEPDALKYFEDATIPDEEFLAIHDAGEDSQLVVHNTNEVDESPVTSEIVERMPEFKEVDEASSDMKQMRDEYQRLRQKLVYKAGGYKKTEKDQATDEVDEDGNPIKVSRFRSARMGLR